MSMVPGVASIQDRLRGKKFPVAVSAKTLELEQGLIADHHSPSLTGHGRTTVRRKAVLLAAPKNLWTNGPAFLFVVAALQALTGIRQISLSPINDMVYIQSTRESA